MSNEDLPAMPTSLYRWRTAILSQWWDAAGQCKHGRLADGGIAKLGLW